MVPGWGEAAFQLAGKFASAPRSSAPNIAESGSSGYAAIDNSGWVVNTGGGFASGSQIPAWVLIAAAAVAVVVYVKLKK